MKRFMYGLREFLRTTFNPSVHPEADRASLQADKVEQTSKKLIAQADNFGMMVQGMRGEPKRGSRRPRKK